MHRGSPCRSEICDEVSSDAIDTAASVADSNFDMRVSSSNSSLDSFVSSGRSTTNLDGGVDRKRSSSIADLKKNCDNTKEVLDALRDVSTNSFLSNYGELLLMAPLVTNTRSELLVSCASLQDYFKGLGVLWALGLIRMMLGL